jgi:Ca-activated chloride channel family protein
MDRAGQPWQDKVSARSGGGSECAALWARAMIRELEDRYAVGDSDAGALSRRVVELSVRFSVLSRFTAFLAVDRSEKVNPGGKQHRAVQPVEPASGWDMLGADQDDLALEAGLPAMEMERAIGGVAMDSLYEAPEKARRQPAAPRMAGFAAPPRGGPMSAGGAASAPPPPSAVARPAPSPAQPGRGRKAKQEVRKEMLNRTVRAPEPAAEEKASALDLVDRLRELAERVAQRASLHPAVLADALVRELDGMAAELAAAGRGSAFARLDRARHAMRALLAGGAGTAELELALVETGQALGEVIAELERTGGGARRTREFWK